jgi:hypothetical protein
MTRRNEKRLSLAELRKLKVGRFRPKPHYDPETDTLTLFVAPDEARRERVDKFLTVYRALGSNAVVGCHVKDVRSVLLKNVKAMHLGIEAKDITLSLLLYTAPLASDGGVASRVYREMLAPLSRIAGKVRIPELVGAN